MWPVGRKKTSSSSYSFAECEELDGGGGEDDDGARFLPSLTAKREKERFDENRISCGECGRFVFQCFHSSSSLGAMVVAMAAVVVAEVVVSHFWTEETLAEPTTQRLEHKLHKHRKVSNAATAEGATRKLKGHTARIWFSLLCPQTVHGSNRHTKH